LRDREGVVEVRHDVLERARAHPALRGEFIDGRPADPDEGELRGEEEAVQRHEQERHEDPPRRDDDVYHRTAGETPPFQRVASIPAQRGRLTKRVDGSARPQRFVGDGGEGGHSPAPE
jgi:hypothetical protein